MKVNYQPDGYRAITPYLLVAGAVKSVEFMKSIFGGEVLEQLDGPGGTIMHAKVEIGDSLVMLGEASAGFPPLPGSLYIYVPDVDATYGKALAAGAAVVHEPMDQFYGDRSAGIRDPAGTVWWIATHKEDVSPEETSRRAALRKG